MPEDELPIRPGSPAFENISHPDSQSYKLLNQFIIKAIHSYNDTKKSMLKRKLSETILLKNNKIKINNEIVKSVAATKRVKPQDIQQLISFAAFSKRLNTPVHIKPTRPTAIKPSKLIQRSPKSAGVIDKTIEGSTVCQADQRVVPQSEAFSNHSTASIPETLVDPALVDSANIYKDSTRPSAYTNDHPSTDDYTHTLAHKVMLSRSINKQSYARSIHDMALTSSIDIHLHPSIDLADPTSDVSDPDKVRLQLGRSTGTIARMTYNNTLETYENNNNNAHIDTTTILLNCNGTISRNIMFKKHCITDYKLNYDTTDAAYQEALGQATPTEYGASKNDMTTWRVQCGVYGEKMCIPNSAMGASRVKAAPRPAA